MQYLPRISIGRFRWIALLCLWGLVTPASAQQLSNAEYFWDTDPGPGNGTALAAADGTYDEAIEAALGSGLGLLANGLHTFSVRFRDGSGWGTSFTTVLSIESTNPIDLPSVALAEYFWDTDPGPGNATTMLALNGAFDEALETALASNVGLLASGLHSLNVRVQDSSGTWGPLFTTVISIEDAIATDLPGLASAEYFWDNDPGPGNGTTLLAFDGNFDEAVERVGQANVSLLPSGLHRLGVRMNNPNSGWGPVFSVIVSMEDSIGLSIPSLVAGEYFWDTDPGQGNANALLATDSNFDETLETIGQNGVGLLASGLHTLNFRFRSGLNAWGPVFRTVISIEDSISRETVQVVSGEAYWDNDPGLGNGIPLAALDGNFDAALETVFDTSIATFSLSLGPHKLVSRIRDDQGNWSEDFGVVVWIDTSLVPVLSQINGPDVFCENDPLTGIAYSVAASNSNSYSWTAVGGTIVSGQGSNTISVDWSGVGTHTISVQACNTDGCGNTLVDTVEVIAAPVAAIDGASSIALCAGEDTVLTATSPGAAALQWFRNGNAITGATGPTYTATASGNYTVEFTAGTNCSATSAATTVNVASALQANAGPDRVICEGAGPTILGGSPTASGSQGGYTYLWSGSNLSANSVANPLASPTVSGTYYLEVTDVLGCVGEDSVSLVVNPTIFVEGGPDLVGCAGAVLPLGGNPTALGGSGGFSYAWSPSAGLSNASSPNPTATLAGATQLILVVTDANNCQARDTVQANISPAILVNAGADIALCDPGAVSLGGNPTGAGGDGPLNYSWSPATGLSDPSLPNPVATVSGPQTYYVTVTDQNNCQVVDQITVGLNPVIGVDAGGDSLLCTPGTVTLGGAPTAFGGSGNFSYSWGGGAVSNASLANPTAPISGSSSFVLTVTDGNNCTATDTVTYAVNPALTIDAGTSVSLCDQAPVTLGGSPTGSGGTGALTYAWTPSTGLSSSASANPVANLTGTQTYTLVITDQNNCQVTDQVTVSVNPGILVDAGPDQILCDPGATPLGGSPTATGGSGGFTYTWTGPAISNPNVANPTATINGNASYTVVVSDGSGCTETDTVNFSVNPSLTIDAGASVSLCDQAPVTLGGSPTGSGGTGALSYAWSPATGLNSPTSANPVANLTGTQTYTLVITDQNNCQVTDQVTVSVNPGILVDAGPDQILCDPGATALGGSPTATGGIGSFSYVWTGPALSNPNVANPTATINGNATYTVVVSDGSGCTETDTVNFSVNPALSIDAGVDVSLCDPLPLTLGGNPTGSGGTGPLAYSWSPSVGLNSATVANPIANVSGSQTYTLVITDQNNCQLTDQVTVSVNPAIVVNAGADQALCDPGVTSLGGTPTATGGSGGFTYAWAGPGISNPNLANPTANVNGNASYVVVVADVNGCTETDTVDFSVNPAIVLDPGNDTLVCAGTPVTLGGSPTASGGSGGFAYQWTPGVGLGNPLAANPVANLSGTTTLSVTATDAANCAVTGTVTITVSPLPAAGYAFATSQSTVTFVNSSSDATTYLWDFGDNNSASLPDPVHTYQQPGLYTVCLVATNSCGSDTLCQDINVSFVDVEDGLGSDIFQVYPNPARDWVYFEPHTEVGAVTLVNQFGQVVKRFGDEWTLGQRHRLDLSALPAAIYQLEVAGPEGEHWRIKLMVNP